MKEGKDKEKIENLMEPGDIYLLKDHLVKTQYIEKVKANIKKFKNLNKVYIKAYRYVKLVLRFYVGLKISFFCSKSLLSTEM